MHIVYYVRICADIIYLPCTHDDNLYAAMYKYVELTAVTTVFRVKYVLSKYKRMLLYYFAMNRLYYVLTRT